MSAQSEATDYAWRVTSNHWR